MSIQFLKLNWNYRMNLKCIVVDDEPIARNGLAKYIRNCKKIELIEECRDAYQAIELLEQKNNIDVIFLDIEMPVLNGLDYLKKIKPEQIIIITSAFSKYAIEGYELNVLDFLLKPISKKRFENCIEKIVEYSRFKKFNEQNECDYFFIKNESLLQKIFFNDILYFESNLNYYKIYTKERYYLQYGSFYKLYEKLNQNIFKKVHRSFIVNLNQITKFNSKSIYIEHHIIPISNNFDINEILENLKYR